MNNSSESSNNFDWLKNNPKVVAIDDDEIELTSLCDALNQMGIEPLGVHTPDGDNMPEQLHGVRILFLDLVLIQGKFDAKQCAGNIMTLLGPTAYAGPVTIIAWTTYPERVQEVQAELDKYNSSKTIDARVLPTSIIPLAKGECQEKEKYVAEKIQEKLGTILSELGSLRFMHEWELKCNTAASRSTGLIAAHCISAKGGDIEAKQWETIHLLAKASAGKDFNEKARRDENFWRAVNEPMGLILSDSIANPSDEHLQENGSSIYSGIDDIQIILSDILKKEHPGANDAPGSVYKMGEIETSLIPTTDPTAKAKAAKFFRGFVLSSLDEGYYLQNKEDVLKTVESCLVEITPACDYAQDKKKMHRFLPALFVPEKMEEHLGNALYLKKISNFVFSDGKVGTLILNCLYHLSLPKTQKLPSPIFRFRSHVVVDILAWHTSHGGRPGILEL